VIDRTLISLVLLLTWAGPASAQVPPDRQDVTPRCTLERRHAPGYVAWICDAEGHAYSDRATVFFVRQARAGGETAQHVWTGPLIELAARFDAIIDAHRLATAHCAGYFHVARAEVGGVVWDRPTRSMTGWWAGPGRLAFSTLCYASQPAGADFVIVWSASGSPLATSFLSLPRPLEPASTVTPEGAVPAVNGAVTSADDEAPAPPVLLAVYPVHVASEGGTARLGLPMAWPDGRDATPATSGGERALESALSLIARAR
jgi:hypothetical protein